MSTLVNWNGQQYLVPAYNDTGYAQGNGNLSQYLVAISTGSLQQVGGLFQLTADADFGPNFGLVSSYFKSRSANIASAGVLRLANTDAIKWRNSDNSADVTLAMNATGTAARTYTIPDLASSSFVMTEGNQTINGSKTFGSAIIGNLTGNASGNLLLTGGTMAGSIAMGGSYKLTGLAAGSTAGDSVRYEQVLLLAGGTMTGTLILPNGTAALPSLTFGDSDTGIWSATANCIRFSSNGALAFSIESTGTYHSTHLLFNSGGTYNIGDATYYPGKIFVGDGTIALPSVAFANDPSTGCRLNGAGYLSFSAAGTNVGQIRSTGLEFASGKGVLASAVVGTTTNDNAQTGFIGEYAESKVAYASRINAGGTGVYTDITSLTLSAGDWDISAVWMVSQNGATISAINTLAITTTSGNSSSGVVYGDNAIQCSIPTGSYDIGAAIPGLRKSISGSTTFYMKFNMAYSAGTPQSYGRISARRVR